MKIAIILNPYANRWKAGKAATLIRQKLDAAAIDYTWHESTKPGDCESIAYDVARTGVDRIIAAGGDGTINEVLNGLMRGRNTKGSPLLGVLPIGTANDFAANIGLSTDLDASIARIASSKTASYDVCTINGRHFINNSGLGLEPYITTIQHRLKGVTGIFRYLLATFMGIAKNPQWEMELQWDTGRYSGPVTMVSIGNGARTGGIFYTTPGANPQDGLMNVLFGSIPSRAGILKAFPRIMKAEAGNIGEHPAMRLEPASHLRVVCGTPSPSHSDGELAGQWLTEFEFRILPAAVEILVDP